jgi:hypothetical protein
MGLLNNLTTFVTGWSAATLTPPPLPKAPNKPVSVPGYRTQAAPQLSAIRRTTRDLANTSRLTARNGRDQYAVTRELAEASPDLSSAVSMLLRTGIPEGYRLVAKDLDGQIDPNGTALAQELLRRLTYLGAADGSYGAQTTLQTLSESLGKELLYYGAAAVEVALDKARIPASLNPISVTKLVAYDEDNSVRWAQKLGSAEVDLDIPTFIYVSVDQLLTDAYSSGFLQASTQPALADAEFTDDMRRVLKRAVHPRLLASIDVELVKKSTPPEILNDPEKWTAYQKAVLAEVESMVNAATPEDAFVSFDAVAYSFVDGGHDPSAVMEKIQSVLNGKLAAGAKTLPVVLGHGGSSNSSSTESLLYLKTADMLRRKLNELYSRALTVALRISGVDGYCEFRYDDLDLRPKSELAAFRSMETSNTLQLLSLGFISDEEAAIALTGHLPPPSFKPLSGTGFFSSNAAGSQISDTSGSQGSNTSAMDRTLKTGTPTQPKGPAK